jgi:hypothetical protein
MVTMADKDDTIWLAEHRLGNAVAIRIGRRGEDLVAEFPNLGTVIVASAGVRFDCHPNAKPDAIDKIKANAIEGLLRHLAGKLTLHGSCCSLGSQAVVFVGPSGSGKSTLAAMLCAGEGFELISDDAVGVEFVEQRALADVSELQNAFWLHPSARNQLGHDARGASKKAIHFARSSKKHVPIAAVLILAFGSEEDGIRVEPLRGHAAFSSLAKSLVRFVIDRPEFQLREFDQLEQLYGAVPIFELRRPRDMSLLTATADAVRKLVSPHELT